MDLRASTGEPQRAGRHVQAEPWPRARWRRRQRRQHVSRRRGDKITSAPHAAVARGPTSNAGPCRTTGSRMAPWWHQWRWRCVARHWGPGQHAAHRRAAHGSAGVRRVFGGGVWCVDTRRSCVGSHGVWATTRGEYAVAWRCFGAGGAFRMSSLTCRAHAAAVHGAGAARSGGDSPGLGLCGWRLAPSICVSRGDCQMACWCRSSGRGVGCVAARALFRVVCLWAAPPTLADDS